MGILTAAPTGQEECSPGLGRRSRLYPGYQAQKDFPSPSGRGIEGEGQTSTLLFPVRHISGSNQLTIRGQTSPAGAPGAFSKSAVFVLPTVRANQLNVFPQIPLNHSSGRYGSI